MGQMLVNIPAPWSIRVGYLNDPKFMTSFWQNPCMILIGKMITNWGGFYFSKKEAGCKFACRPMCYKIGFSFWDTNISAVVFFFINPCPSPNIVLFYMILCWLEWYPLHTSSNGQAPCVDPRLQRSKSWHVPYSKCWLKPPTRIVYSWGNSSKSWVFRSVRLQGNGYEDDPVDRARVGWVEWVEWVEWVQFAHPVVSPQGGWRFYQCHNVP